MWLYDALLSVTGAQLLALLCAYVGGLVAVAALSALLRAATAPARRAVQGAHVVITGGSEGIGLAIALEAAAQGAGVTIVARSVGKLEKAVAQIKAAAASAEQHVGFLSCDVTDAAAVATAMGAAAATAPIAGVYRQAAQAAGSVLKK